MTYKYPQSLFPSKSILETYFETRSTARVSCRVCSFRLLDCCFIASASSFQQFDTLELVPWRVSGLYELTLTRVERKTDFDPVKIHFCQTFTLQLHFTIYQNASILLIVLQIDQPNRVPLVSQRYTKLLVIRLIFSF